MFPSLCALPLQRSAVPVSVRAAATAVGCSRLGARCRCGGRLFPSRCALPLQRSAVPVSVRAAAAVVGCSRFGGRCRCGGRLFLLWWALPLRMSGIPLSVSAAAVVVRSSGSLQAGAALVLCFRLGVFCCCGGKLVPFRCALLLVRPVAPVCVRGATVVTGCFCCNASVRNEDVLLVSHRAPSCSLMVYICRVSLLSRTFLYSRFLMSFYAVGN